MTTQTHAPSARPTTRPARLRRLVAVGSLAPLLALAACSGDEPITSQGRAATGAATAASTAEATAATESATTTPTTTVPSSASGPEWYKPAALITDAALGHRIRVLNLVRNATWPQGNPLGEESFEIVALRLEVTAGSRYSAEVNPWLFTVVAPPQNVSVNTTLEFGNLLGGALNTAKRAEKRSGWIYFKVDRGAETITLRYHRPEHKVSTTGKTIPAQVFSVALPQS